MELYASLVIEYRNNDEFDLLKKAVEDNDLKNAFELAHTMKGVYGNLGLTPLYEPVCRIVEVLRSGTFNGISGDMELLEVKKKELNNISE